MPGQAPSALTRSSAPTGVVGFSGGALIDTLLIDSLPACENQSASLEKKSDVFEQPAIIGANASSSDSRPQYRLSRRTINQVPRPNP